MFDSLLGILAFCCVSFTIAAFIKNLRILGIVSAAFWLLFGLEAMASSSGTPTEITDVYMGIFWLGMIMTVGCILFAALMRDSVAPKDTNPLEEISEEDKFIKDIEQAAKLPKLPRFGRRRK
jgi:predicted tellurium resistance membrane protein TerC